MAKAPVRPVEEPTAGVVIPSIDEAKKLVRILSVLRMAQLSPETSIANWQTEEDPATQIRKFLKAKVAEVFGRTADLGYDGVSIRLTEAEDMCIAYLTGATTAMTQAREELERYRPYAERMTQHRHTVRELFNNSLQYTNRSIIVRSKLANIRSELDGPMTYVAWLIARYAHINALKALFVSFLAEFPSIAEAVTRAKELAYAEEIAANASRMQQAASLADRLRTSSGGASGSGYQRRRVARDAAEATASVGVPPGATVAQIEDSPDTPVVVLNGQAYAKVSPEIQARAEELARQFAGR